MCARRRERRRMEVRETTESVALGCENVLMEKMRNRTATAKPHTTYRKLQHEVCEWSTHIHVRIRKKKRNEKRREIHNWKPNEKRKARVSHSGVSGWAICHATNLCLCLTQTHTHRHTHTHTHV